MYNQPPQITKNIDLEYLKNKPSNITIVTVYYNIKSKFPSSTYLSWMENFLRIPCNLVIFTDNNSYETIKNFRVGLEHKTHIIIKNIEDFFNYQYYDYYKYSHTIDVEKNHHTPELYMVWNEKSYFVKEVIEKNPFNSEWFFWTDIGCVRDNKMLEFISSYPNDDKITSLDRDKMNLVSIVDFENRDNIKDENWIPIIFKNISNESSCKEITRIQGGFFGGHRNCWGGWIERFEKMMKKMMESNTFIGKDQYIMASVYLNNPETINLIKAHTSYGDPWWYFLYLFS
jgi:hypothetical protein